MSMAAGKDFSTEHLEHPDPLGARIGMWLFLLTELILFGGLFLLYAVYRSQYTNDFHFAASHLNSLVGAFNTLILLTSSLTMVLAIDSLGKGHRKRSVYWLVATLLAGAGFMVNKYFEWSEKFEHGLYPGAPELFKRTSGENLFFSLYYAMTGLHGIHVLVGMILLLVYAVLILKKSAETMHTSLENVGLYWHLVDVIWIFLFPLFYLIS